VAERPVFIPSPHESGFVEVRSLSFVWAPGFAVVQKRRNIRGLHEAAARVGYSPLLEVSTKSDDELGRQLSAFNLKLQTQHAGLIPVECAFQGSKTFLHGGPYIDLCQAEPRGAKRDERLRESGRLVGFNFGGQQFPLEPRTAFYDWLYVSALLQQRESLAPLCRDNGFTDIEFAPDRSINCQARSCALFVALTRAHLLDEAMGSPAAFIRLVGAP
jgi:hypothetical protein